MQRLDRACNIKIATHNISLQLHATTTTTSPMQHTTDLELQLFKLSRVPAPRGLVVGHHEGEEGPEHLPGGHDLGGRGICAEHGQNAHQGLLQFVVLVLAAQLQVPERFGNTLKVGAATSLWGRGEGRSIEFTPSSLNPQTP